MPSFERQLLELRLRFDLVDFQLTEIIDNLFFIRLELEAGRIPVFPPTRVPSAIRVIGKYQ